MSEKNGSAAGNGKPDIDALRAEIAQTRAELGETVQALAAKADVKARAKEQVEHTKQQVRAQAAEVGEKVRDAALAASGKVRTAAGQASERARDTAVQVRESGALDPQQVRNRPVPYAAVAAGVIALVAVILIVRGKRR